MADTGEILPVGTFKASVVCDMMGTRRQNVQKGELKMSKYYIVRIREQAEEFVKQSKVAVGWSDVDFTKFKGDGDGLAEAVKKCYYSDSDVSPYLLGRKRSEVKRFINIKKGDIIIVPGYKSFYLGETTDEFIYDESKKNIDLANQLKVNFKKDREGEPIPFERKGKNTALMTKLRARGFTVLEVRNDQDSDLTKYIDELMREEQDISDAAKINKKEQEERKRFKIDLKNALSNYSRTSFQAGGIGFEDLIKNLMECDGYEVKRLDKAVGGSGKADADIQAVKKSLLVDGFSTAVYIQAKHYSGESENGIDQIIEFKKKVNENFEDFDIGVKSENIQYALISSGEFDRKVREKADINNIVLIDGDKLAEILFDKIDKLPEEIRYQLGFIKKYEHI